MILQNQKLRFRQDRSSSSVEIQIRFIRYSCYFINFNLEDAINSTFIIDGDRFFAIKLNRIVSEQMKLTLSTTSSFATFDTADLVTAFSAVAYYPSIGLLGDDY